MATFELYGKAEEGASRGNQPGGFGNDVLVNNARWFVSLRWVVAFVLAVAGVGGKYFPSIYGCDATNFILCWPCRLAAVLMLANIYFSIRVKKLTVQSSRSEVFTSLWTQIAFDLVVLTAVVHYVGSIETFISFTYLFHIVLACIFFSRGSSLAVTLLAAALYTVCVALEANGIWTKSCVVESLITIRPENAIYAVIYPASAIAIWLVVWYLVSTLASTVHERNVQITLVNEQLNKAHIEKNQQMLKTTHDLKAPFSGMENNIQMLRMLHWDSLSDEVKDLIERIETRAKILRERIKEILLLGDLRSVSENAKRVEWEDIDLRGLFDKVLEEVQGKATARKIEIDMDIPAVDVRSNKKKLVTLFSNLLSNAVFYSPEGAHVQVVAERRDAELVVSIVDKGIGISKEALPRIFEEFYISKEGSQFNKLSSGLGLAIVHEIVDMLELQIRVESELGKGSRFEVIMPDAKDADGRNIKQKEESKMAKVQIIDDEVDLAGNLKILLEKEGHTAFTFNEVEGAVDEIIKNAPDVLVLDVMFPGNPAGGFDIARAARTRDELKSLPIIMLTGVNQEMPVDFSSQDIDSDWLPVQDFLEKPVDMPKLIETINGLLKS